MDSPWIGMVSGLASALGWGTGDFCGGVASKRGRVLGVVLISEIIGVLALIGLTPFLSEPVPAPADLLWAGAAGILGTIGLVTFYRALAAGRMGVVASITAVVAAAVPVLFGSFLEGPPNAVQYVGFGLALVALWLVSQTGGESGIRARDLGLAVLAGLGFGGFLILIDHASQESIVWPLVASRSVSLGSLVVLMVLMRSALPARGQLGLAAMAGVLDSAGNAFYALAARVGRLDVAAALSSLGPAATVLLARAILKERISRRQWLGVATALAAVVLIASG